MNKLNPPSFEKFYNKIQFFPEYWKSLMPSTNINSDQESDWIKRAQVLDQLSAQNHVVVLLWNAFSNRFIFMSDKLRILGGYAPDLFTTEDGVNFSFSLIHPDHLNATLLLYEIGMNYGLNKGLKSYDNVVLSFNYLYKSASGKYIHFLQQCIIVEADDTMQPKLVLSFAQNISHIKKENTVGLIITSPLGVEIVDYNLYEQRIEEVKAVSPQELKILELLSQSFDTKKIAGLLNISPHTVDTHRRNLINKVNCHDTTGVVTFARLINLI